MSVWQQAQRKSAIMGVQLTFVKRVHFMLSNICSKEMHRGPGDGSVNQVSACYTSMKT